jgi:hypothetical protein
MLQWIKIADLVIDPSYQRPILGEGRRNVARIARHFRWSYFAPVVVSPVEGGRFAIIDGQHRTTAAALVGIKTVPCQVVIAARDEQAAAFKAINGATTRISRMALQAAAVVANEPAAIEVAEICPPQGLSFSATLSRSKARLRVRQWRWGPSRPRSVAMAERHWSPHFAASPAPRTTAPALSRQG